jgi:hypothetical protein
MPKAKGPQEKYEYRDQMRLVLGEIGYEANFMEEINREMRDKWDLMQCMCDGSHRMYAVLTKKIRVKIDSAG